jgi:ABC-type multidrug transport system fused ATPase/permease subunit
MDTNTILVIVALLIALGFAVYLFILALKLLGWIFRNLAVAVHNFFTALVSLVRAPVAPLRELVRPQQTPNGVQPFRATHLVYLALFITGVLISAATLTTSVPDAVPSLKPLFIIPMAIFAVTNCVHQYLIYRDILEAEESDSNTYRRFGGWWIGTPLEIAIRVTGMVGLLVLSQEIHHQLLDPFTRYLDARLNNSTGVVVLANFSMYGTFLVWNLPALGLIRRRSPLAPEQIAEAISNLKTSISSDALACLQWGCVILLLLGWQAAALVIMMLTVVYAINVLWQRSPARTRRNFNDRLYRVYFALTVLGVFLILYRTPLLNVLNLLLFRSTSDLLHNIT